MHITLFDWVIIVGYCLFTLVIGLLFCKKAGKNKESFFLAGKNLPWWLAGTSLIATSFAIDTPLVISAFIRKEGIYGNWLWWIAGLGGIFQVFFFARLWRRSGVLTFYEFIELRYKGNPALIYRVFSVVIITITYCINIGWINLAALKIFDILFDFPPSISLGFTIVPTKLFAIVLLTAIVFVYTILSGFWGVVITDFIQFFMAMIGSIALAIIVLTKMGGPGAMVEAIQNTENFRSEVFSFIPTFATAGKLAFFTFCVFISLHWWAGAQGNAMSAQRQLACKDEKQAGLATLWSSFADITLRTWPWLLVGLASLVYFPLKKGEDPELAYPKMMAMFLPAGLRGIMIISFIAAFMSTVDTLLNTAGSFFVNDIYIRLFKSNATEKHYVRASRLSTFIVLILAGIITWKMNSITNAWKYVGTVLSGIGFASIFRWFWWRMNAWSEISAMIASVIITNALYFVELPYLGDLGKDEMFGVRLFITILISTITWIVISISVN